MEVIFPFELTASLLLGAQALQYSKNLAREILILHQINKLIVV